MIKISIYQPSYLYPSNVSIDSSVSNIFTAQINGTIATDYQLKIYNLSNTLLYDTGKVHLTTPLYNKDIFSLNIPANSLNNGQNLKWTLQLWENANTAMSRETPFFSNSIPTLTMSVNTTITSKSATFTAIYSQSNGIALNRWKMFLLDNNGSIIQETDYSYSGLISWTYDGFISGNSYKIYTVVENQMNVSVQSDTYAFSVDYSSPSLSVIPETTLLPDLSAIQVNWSAPVQIDGVISGASQYIDNLYTPNNTGLDLIIPVGVSTWYDTETTDDSNTFDDTTGYDDSLDGGTFLTSIFGNAPESQSSYIDYTVDIPSAFTVTLNYQLDKYFHDGVFVELTDFVGVTYEIGYDGEKFYYNNNGIIVSGTPKELLNGVFLLVIKGIEVLIIQDNEVYEYLHP